MTGEGGSSVSASSSGGRGGRAVITMRWVRLRSCVKMSLYISMRIHKISI